MRKLERRWSRELVVIGVHSPKFTYNHKIKRLDPRTGECRTWLGDGQPGLVDGAATTARFSEPCGVALARGRVFVADTNNHVIRVAALATGEVRTLELRGLAPPS